MTSNTNINRGHNHNLLFVGFSATTMANAWRPFPTVATESTVDENKLEPRTSGRASALLPLPSAAGSASSLPLVDFEKEEIYQIIYIPLTNKEEMINESIINREM